MKIFEGCKEQKKSWSIKLKETTVGLTSLIAVDSISGLGICVLISFDNDGAILLWPGAKNILLDEGYDPHEYNNGFSECGSIITRIDNGG